MRPQSRPRTPLLICALAGGTAGALVAGLPTASSASGWGTAVPVAGASASTGSLAIVPDTLAPGGWTMDGQAWDAKGERLTAGRTIVRRVDDVPLTAVGENLRAGFSVSGARIPAPLAGHVTVSLASAPATIAGSNTATPGSRTADLTLNVTADDGLPSGEQTIDLSELTVTLSNGRGWSDTATLDAGTVLTGSPWTPPPDPASGMTLNFDLTHDTDKVVGFYLTNPAPGTTIRWGVWSGADEVSTPAVHGLNSFDYSGFPSATGSAVYVRINGSFQGFGSPAQTEDLIGSLFDVQGWSTAYGTTSAAYAFYNATRLGAVATMPSTVTDASYAFANAGWRNSAQSIWLPWSSWQASGVRNLAHMFDGADVNWAALNSWQTASVTNMSGMFRNSKVNGPLGAWDTSNVTDMSRMFENATAFNQNLGSWNTGRVTDMTAMFKGAGAFSQDLRAWDVANVTRHADFEAGSALTPAQVPLWPGASYAAPAPLPMPLPADDPTADPSPEPEPAPEPSPGPTAEPSPEPSPELSPEPAPEPTAEPSPEPTVPRDPEDAGRDDGEPGADGPAPSDRSGSDR